MPEESRLGKLLMVAPPDGWVDGAQDWLDDLQPAGIILFKRNLPADFDAARAAVARLHEWAAKRGETLLVAADEEGGFVTQTSAWLPVPPAARALAWMGEPELVRQAFARYSKRLRHFGINLDFAPVCDVNNNPLNPVIGARSFATEAAAVTLYARAVHDGLAAAGVLSCAKHFPGHGDTDVDSHLALPVVAHDRARLEHVELVPFRALAAEVPVVMVAHVACPAVGDGALPATLSPRIATALLRHEVGFTGVAVTDAMDMQGVAGQFGDEEAGCAPCSPAAISFFTASRSTSRCGRAPGCAQPSRRDGSRRLASRKRRRAFAPCKAALPPQPIRSICRRRVAMRSSIARSVAARSVFPIRRDGAPSGAPCARRSGSSSPARRTKS